MKGIRYLVAAIAICYSTASFAQIIDHRGNIPVTSSRAAKGPSVTATEIQLNLTTKDHSESDYKLSGIITYTVNGKGYTCPFTNTEVGVGTESEFCDDSGYYPVGNILVTNGKYSLQVSIQREKPGFDEFIGSNVFDL